jgi:hypothetical protein
MAEKSFADFKTAGDYTLSFLKTAEINFRKHCTPEREMNSTSSAL